MSILNTAPESLWYSISVAFLERWPISFLRKCLPNIQGKKPLHHLPSVIRSSTDSGNFKESVKSNYFHNNTVILVAFFTVNICTDGTKETLIKLLALSMNQTVAQNY
jgi:hypothetical protein